MRHAQIKRLRALKERDVVLLDLEELIDILLMEREDYDGERVPPPVKGELMTPRQRAEWEAAVKVQADLIVMEREGHDGVVVPQKGRIES